MIACVSSKPLKRAGDGSAMQVGWDGLSSKTTQLACKDGGILMNAQGGQGRKSNFYPLCWCLWLTVFQCSKLHALTSFLRPSSSFQQLTESTLRFATSARELDVLLTGCLLSCLLPKPGGTLRSKKFGPNLFRTSLREIWHLPETFEQKFFLVLQETVPK